MCRGSKEADKQDSQAPGLLRTLERTYKSQRRLWCDEQGVGQEGGHEFCVRSSIVDEGASISGTRDTLCHGKPRGG